MNAAYKHLDSKLRVAELTIGQWLGIFFGTGLGLAYVIYMHPFGTTLTLMSGVYVGGLPICLAFISNMSEFNLWLMTRAAVAWMRDDGRYVPGGGAATRGYTVTDDLGARAERARDLELDLSSLWSDHEHPTHD